MLIPGPIATLLTAVACKVVCNTIFEEDDRSSARRINRDHDVFSPDMARDLIREELDRRTEQRDEEGDDDDDDED